MNSLKKTLMELDNIPGVTGDEQLVADYFDAQLNEIVDNNYSDALGNNVYVKNGKNSDLKIMLSAHMDEIGFVVHYIDEKGFIYFLPVGHHDDRTVFNQTLNIHTDKGIVKGVTGGKPAHILTPEEIKETMPIEDLFIDVGANSREEAFKLGVQVGDYITFDREGQFLNDSKIYTGKSVDNRVGCAVLIEAMKRLKDKEIEPTVYAVASVQEEVALRGAGPIAAKIKPDVAIALDVCLAGGTPSVKEHQMPLQLNQGPGIMFYDWTPSTGEGNNVPKRLTKKMVNTAEENNIPYQRSVFLNGGTDASSISLSHEGVLAGGILTPTRYIHSATGIVHMDDIEHTVQLVVSLVESITEKL